MGWSHCFHGGHVTLGSTRRDNRTTDRGHTQIEGTHALRRTRTNRTKGIPPPPPPGGLPRMPPPPFVNPSPPVAPPPLNKRDMDGDDAAGKKSRTEPAEANLVPEDQFLSSNPNPVTFGVQIPNMPDKSEWKLDGSTVRLTLPLTDQISVIKAKLHEITGMPAGKQKLQLGGIFIKDSNSLAYYNVTPASVVQLQLKERGGRKK